MPNNANRYLLLQVRDHDDPIREQEIGCFARAIGCEASEIATINLLDGSPPPAVLDKANIVFIGGSGNYSVVEGGPWLGGALETIRNLYDLAKPTFASCWGFQAFALALGGEVVTDLQRAELGSTELKLTSDGVADPLFRELSSPFLGQMGHQDIVDRLPADALLLASSDRVTHQAFRMKGKPIYGTQFHPELDRTTFIERVELYPQYVERISHMPLKAFVEQHCIETVESNQLLRRFVEMFG